MAAWDDCGTRVPADWTDKNVVINYAKTLGSGLVVYKDPARKNFNITHGRRSDNYRPEWVVFRT